MKRRGLRAPLSAMLLAVLFLPTVLGQTVRDEYGFVVAGRRFSFVIAPNTGNVSAMGSNVYGQLGIGSDVIGVNRPTMVALPTEAWIVGAAAGAFHSLFVENGTGRAWAAGRNHWGAFGAVPEGGSYDQENSPVQVADNVAAVAAGYGHSLFLRTFGTVEAAGLNSMGQLGDGTLVNSALRKRVVLPDPQIPVTRIAAGYDFSLFLKENGDVYGVGNNLGGQLGDNSGISTATPVKVDVSLMGGRQVVDVSAGEAHALFLTADFKVYGTGSNAATQINFAPNTPRMMPELSHFEDGASISAGGDSSCVSAPEVTVRGQLSCAGSNLNGQLGIRPVGIVNSPAEVADVFVYAASIGSAHGLAITADYSEVLVTGSNANGELGDGANADRQVFFELDDFPSFPRTTPAPTPPPTPRDPAAPTPTPANPPTILAMIGVSVVGVGGIGGIVLASFLFFGRTPRGDPAAETQEDFGVYERSTVELSES